MFSLKCFAMFFYKQKSSIALKMTFKESENIFSTVQFTTHSHMIERNSVQEFVPLLFRNMSLRLFLCSFLVILSFFTNLWKKE